MKKSIFSLRKNGILFTRGKIYECMDSDDECDLFKADNGDWIIVEKYKLNKHFMRVNVMPEFSK